MAMLLWEPRPRGDTLVVRRGQLIGARRPSHKWPAARLPPGRSFLFAMQGDS